jgi:hypothetical protein
MSAPFPPFSQKQLLKVEGFGSRKRRSPRALFREKVAGADLLFSPRLKALPSDINLRTVRGINDDAYQRWSGLRLRYAYAHRRRL